MRTIQNLKIKYKLIFIIMSTVIISLILAGSVLIVSERYLAKQSMVDKLMTISHIIADRSTAALSFNDKKVANEVLSALAKESSVILGCIYDGEKALFSSYGNQRYSKCPNKPGGEGYKFRADGFELYLPITLEGEVIGTVYILATLDKLNERLLTFVLLVFVMIVVVGVLAYFIARRQQGIISNPILDLTRVTRCISNSGDYTERLPLGSDDEIGTLNLAFNDMLEQIHKRETQRDKAEQELSEREQDLVVTLNSIGDAVIVTDKQGLVTRMNPVAEQLTGWTFKEAELQPIKSIFPIINATTRESIENPVKTVVQSGKTVFLNSHTTLITKSGEEVHIADSAAPIRNAQGEILGMILVFNDVTEQYKLREAAAKSKRDLQAIMDNSPAAIHVEDLQGKLIFINKKFDKQFHIKNKNIIGKSLNEIFPLEIAEIMQKNDQIVLNTGKAIEAEEVAPQEDGYHTYSSIKFPLFNEENHIYAVCSISTDITDRRKQEEQLRRSQKMDALGKLTGGIAHDYNNLLGIIMGYAELLSDKLTDKPELTKYVKDIEHAAERGAKLTKKLLTFTRHKNADDNLLNINQLIKDQQLMLEKTLTARISLEMCLLDELWSVWIDSGDLEDAIINISINASHAINGSGTIIFETSNVVLGESDENSINLASGEYVLLSISDTGAGMDKATSERIFDPFFSTKGDKGTGLGLSQVYGFVKRSGGDIKVFSEPGTGTRFDLYFPKSNRVDVKNLKGQNVSETSLHGSESILVVDDEKALVDLAKDILTGQGYRVFTANSGKQALEILKNEKIDLMMSDVIMPNMDGYQLAEKVMKKYPDVKIQLASGYADGRDDHVTNKKLQEDLLFKPYTSSDVLGCVRKLLNISEIKETEELYNHTNEKNIRKDENTTSIGVEPESTEKQEAMKTILIMDDEKDVVDLFVLSLEMLGYNTVTAGNSVEAISLSKRSMQNGKKIDAAILDLNIPGDLRGGEVALKIRELDSDIKLIVCSGDTLGPEMSSYENFGFDGALEKTFNRQKIKDLFEKIF